MSSRRLPNLVVAGVNKAGTTSLFTYLSRHPDICAANKKETCYFLPVRYEDKISPILEYERHFEHCRGQKYILESTPGYFYGGRKIAETIDRTLGEIRVLVVLRDPVERAFSFYKKRKNRSDIAQEMCFDDYISACENLGPTDVAKKENNTYFGIKGGFYSDFIDDWFEVFGERFRVYFFDDLKNDSKKLSKEICEWLGLDSGVYEQTAFEAENKTVNFRLGCFQKLAYFVYDNGESFFRSHPKLKKRIRDVYRKLNAKAFEERISDSARKRLCRIYDSYNKKLAVQLIERGYSDLPAWLT